MLLPSMGVALHVGFIYNRLFTTPAPVSNQDHRLSDYELYLAQTRAPIVPVSQVDLRFYRRQDACPTGQSTCGSTCCDNTADKCWSGGEGSTCAPVGQCPSTGPVLCHDFEGDPNGQNANIFYCCNTGYVCAPSGQSNNCILQQASSTAAPQTVTVQSIVTQEVTVHPTPTPTPTPSPMSTSTTGAEFVASATETSDPTSSNTAPPTTTAAATSGDTTKKKDSNIGPIVGGVVGGLAVLAAIVWLIWVIFFRRKPTPPSYNPGKMATVSSYAGSPQHHGQPSPNPYINHAFAGFGAGRNWPSPQGQTLPPANPAFAGSQNTQGPPPPPGWSPPSPGVFAPIPVSPRRSTATGAGVEQGLHPADAAGTSTPARSELQGADGQGTLTGTPAGSPNPSELHGITQVWAPPPQQPGTPGSTGNPGRPELHGVSQGWAPSPPPQGIYSLPEQYRNSQELSA